MTVAGSDLDTHREKPVGLGGGCTVERTLHAGQSGREGDGRRGSYRRRDAHGEGARRQLVVGEQDERGVDRIDQVGCRAASPCGGEPVCVVPRPAGRAEQIGDREEQPSCRIAWGIIEMECSE